MYQLCCNKTTESGADEVYILVMGQSSDGRKYFDRAPAPNAHWDMNDGDQPNDNSSGDSRCISNKTLFSGDLANGQTWWLNIVISEEDGGTSRSFQENAGNLLIATGNPYAATAGAILQGLSALGFNITDSDDWMGMVGVKVTNNNGAISVEWTSKEGISSGNDQPQATANVFTMNHDGSDYSGGFAIQ